MDPEHLQREMERDANDVALLATLSALTQQAEAMSLVAERTTLGYGDAFRRATQGPAGTPDFGGMGMGEWEGMGWMAERHGGFLAAARGPASRRRAGSRRGPVTR